MLALVAELATEGKPQNTRQLAGLYIKNLITAKVSRFYILETFSYSHYNLEHVFLSCLILLFASKLPQQYNRNEDDNSSLTQYALLIWLGSSCNRGEGKEMVAVRPFVERSDQSRGKDGLLMLCIWKTCELNYLPIRYGVK